MTQPFGTLQFYNSLNDQWNNGMYRLACYKYFPLLGSKTRLLPFQLQRLSGGAITVFKLVHESGSEIDLIADVGLLKIQDYDEGFTQITYTAETDLTTAITDGFYYIQIYDGTNTYYSDYISLKSLKLGLYGFGQFDSSFSDAFMTEGIISDSTNQRFILNWINTYDLSNKIYQDGYNDVLVVDKEHLTTLVYNGEKKEEIIDKSTGVEIIEATYYFNEYQLTFVHNIAVAKFLVKSNLLDKFTLITKEYRIILPDAFEIEIDEVMEEFTAKIKITFKLNYKKAYPANYNFD